MSYIVFLLLCFLLLCFLLLCFLLLCFLLLCSLFPKTYSFVPHKYENCYIKSTFLLGFVPQANLHELFSRCRIIQHSIDINYSYIPIFFKYASRMLKGTNRVFCIQFTYLDHHILGIIIRFKSH